MVWTNSANPDLKEQSIQGYRKFPKYSDTQNICCNHYKIWTMWLYHRVMSPNYADRMANNVDPDQTALAVWYGSALFSQAYLFKNVGSLRYRIFHSFRIFLDTLLYEKTTLLKF